MVPLANAEIYETTHHRATAPSFTHRHMAVRQTRGAARGLLWVWRAEKNEGKDRKKIGLGALFYHTLMYHAS